VIRRIVFLFLWLWSHPAGAEPPRIVAVGGAVTEIVAALGAAPDLVGVDLTSTYPSTLSGLPRVGYLRNLGAEGTLSLRPTMVIASTEAGPPATLDRLREAKVAVHALAEPLDGEMAAKRIVDIAALLGRQGDGEALVGHLRRDLVALDRWRDGLATRPRVLFLLSVGQGPMLAGGRNTPADAMIRLAGGANVAAALEGYKPVSAEAALAMAPAVVLTTDRSVLLSGGREALLALPAIAATPAARDGRLIAMDGLYLLGFGPRLPLALKQLGAALHPERPPS
jgi:iron complex transport system substrate-binding protein